MVSTLNMSANPVRLRTLYTPSTTTMAPTTTSRASNEEYSYMLPQGTRSAARPRATTETRFAPTPTIATRRETFQIASRRNARKTK